MKILADTQIFLRSFLEPQRVRAGVRQLLEDGEVYLSAVSALEIAIKAGQGKLHLPDTLDKYVPAKMQQAGFFVLPVTHEHALQTYFLPLHHKDPFDRLLIAQAIIEDVPILTADQIFRLYPVKIIDAEKYKMGETIN